MRPLFLDRPTDRDICDGARADGLQTLAALYPSVTFTHCVTRSPGLIVNQHPNIEPTDKLLSHLISLPEVICPEDEGVDDAEHRDHVRDVVRGLQLVHDDTEAVLLCLHTLRGELKVSAKGGGDTCYFRGFKNPSCGPTQEGAVRALLKSEDEKPCDTNPTTTSRF